MEQRSSRLGASQHVAIGTSSAASAAFGAQTRQIRVAVSQTSGTFLGVFIEIGDGTPTAVATTSAIIPSNGVGEYFAVTPGQKIAVIATGTSPVGKLSVTEIV